MTIRRVSIAMLTFTLLLAQSLIRAQENSSSDQRAKNDSLVETTVNPDAKGTQRDSHGLGSENGKKAVKLGERDSITATPDTVVKVVKRFPDRTEIQYFKNKDKGKPFKTIIVQDDYIAIRKDIYDKGRLRFFLFYQNFFFPSLIRYR